ncbi:hypothetical protein B7494_g6319 [Chlorociboria aeruginascens]|nr:hypothetical protein B7494_g6319 [Chlorociboria aeruginascens]
MLIKAPRNAMLYEMNQIFLIASLWVILQNFLVTALKIASSTSTIEYTPELITLEDYFTVSSSITNGGVANLFSDSTIDVAGNAETQALINYATHKDLRIIYTVAQVYYRIVARKASGISVITDLKGKNIGTFPGTSAAYFVYKYLASVGLQPSDYTTVPGNICLAAPCGSGTLPYMLAQGQIDALGMWEPMVELAYEALGSSNAIIFQNRTVYREIFNLHSTIEKLNDATTRADIVSFIQSLNQAETAFNNNTSNIWPRVASALGMSTSVLQAVWPVITWNGTLPSDLLDVMVEEDQWVAQTQNRVAMTSSDLANLIDPTVAQDALSSSSRSTSSRQRPDQGQEVLLHLRVVPRLRGQLCLSTVNVVAKVIRGLLIAQWVRLALIVMRIIRNVYSAH